MVNLKNYTYWDLLDLAQEIRSKSKYTQGYCLRLWTLFHGNIRVQVDWDSWMSSPDISRLTSIAKGEIPLKVVGKNKLYQVGDLISSLERDLLDRPSDRVETY